MSTSQFHQPFLSICIPTFNRARYLECLLQDLVGQLADFKMPYEILIGDNCSQDTTSEVVSRYSQALNLVYFKRPHNLGAYENINHLYRAARGKYTIYLADDDLLMLEAVHDVLQLMEANPGVGVVFAPWLIHDRVASQDLMQFYSLDSDVLVQQGDHASLFMLLINRHLFPEIYITRTELRQSVNLPVSPHAFIFFTQAAVLLDKSSMLFIRQPFYRSVSRYFVDDARSQEGHEEVKVGWDRYRGGLEYILSRFANRLAIEDLAACRAGIDRFTAIRMSVGLRLRTADNCKWIDNYYLAARLRIAGHEDLLPAPYDYYRVCAALEHLLSLQPFLPASSHFAYLAMDPPQILVNAQEFGRVPFNVMQGENLTLPAHTILLTSNIELPPELKGVSVNEKDLLALFP